MAELISPSLMCVDLMNVEQGVRALEEAGVDFLHVDIMDNHFVPNITLCPDFVQSLREITQIPLDVHLMVEQPEDFLPQYSFLGAGDFLTIHYEATLHPQKALGAIRAMGVRPGLALNPATPVEALEYLLDDVEMVLLMTVNPGFAGQKLIPSMLKKLEHLKRYLLEKGYENTLIEVDGNVSFENAVKMHALGADIFVGGSSSVFSREGVITENCRKLKSLLKSES